MTLIDLKSFIKTKVEFIKSSKQSVKDHPYNLYGINYEILNYIEVLENNNKNYNKQMIELLTSVQKFKNDVEGKIAEMEDAYRQVLKTQEENNCELQKCMDENCTKLDEHIECTSETLSKTENKVIEIDGKATEAIKRTENIDTNSINNLNKEVDYLKRKQEDDKDLIKNLSSSISQSFNELSSVTQENINKNSQKLEERQQHFIDLAHQTNSDQTTPKVYMIKIGIILVLISGIIAWGIINPPQFIIELYESII